MKQPLLSSKRSGKSGIAAILPYIKQKRILYTWIGLVLILVIAACISLFSTGKNQFILYRQNVEVLSYQGSLYVAVDDKILNNGIQTEKFQKFCASLDGRVAVFLTDAKELYLVQNRELKKIADDVLHFEISSSGMGVAFAQKYAQEYTLTLYDVKEDSRKEITAQLSNLDFSLSPDGQTLAYYTQIDSQDVLMYHSKNEELIVCRNKSDLVGLSNDGKQIYAICPKGTETSALYAFTHRGKRTELGAISSMSCKFSDDHQQIMFYNNGVTMISTNGRPAEVASNYPLYLVTAPNSHSVSDGNSITLPVTSLFEHIYTCSDGEATSAWLIRKDPQKNKKLISRVSGCTLDASGEYLYYIHNQSQLCVMSVADRSFRSHVLAEEADTYAVLSNRSKVYYTNEDTLYCTSGKRNAATKCIATDISSYNLTMSASDVLFYLSGNDLYACKNERKGNLAVKNNQSFYSSPNGVVYIIGDGEIYAAYSKKQPVKILSAD